MPIRTKQQLKEEVGKITADIQVTGSSNRKKPDIYLATNWNSRK